MFPLICQNVVPQLVQDDYFIAELTGFSVSNYMTTHVCSSHPVLVCGGVGGGSWTSPTSSREVTDVTSDLTCRGSVISAEARFQTEGTGCPDRLLGHGPAEQAVKRSRGLPSHFASVTFVLASLHFPPPSVVLMKLSRGCHSLMSGCASQHDG